MDKTNQTVYISYNINDLSVSSFVSYLNAALNSQRIDVVIDKTPNNNLGNNKFTNIILFLVVFSNSYACSVASLHNLLQLLDFLHKEGRAVVPVFYDNVAKKQMEVFSDAFSMLEESYSADQVSKWRHVLAKTMKLQGHQYTYKIREESKFIEKIVKDVFKKIYPTEHIGLNKKLLELEKLLCKQRWGHRSIGIFGNSGIGKTVLTKAAVRRMSRAYDPPHLIIECNEKIVELFSEELFKEVPVTKFDLNNQDNKPCFRRKRVILALDDVQNAQDVESFLEGFCRFGAGSLLIITSRYKHVLDQCGVNEVYELKGLNDKNSRKLFTRCVYGEDVVEEDLPDSLQREIQQCDGNPSIIRSYAAKMKRQINKDMSATTRSICHHSFTHTKKNTPLSCFQVTSNRFPLTLKEVFSYSAAHNYQSDLDKLPELDILKQFLNDVMDLILDLNSVQHNNLFNRKNLSRLNFPIHALESLPSAIRIPHLGQECVLAYQLNKPWKEYMGFQDYTSLKSTILDTNQLEPIQVLNICGCIEIKHFPEFAETIRELKTEGKLQQWRLQTAPLCLLCNSTNETGSYIYFDLTFCWNIKTTISNRFQALVNLTGSKAMEILSRITTYGLWIERNHCLYRQNYRSTHLRRIIGYLTLLRRKKPKMAFRIFKLLLGSSYSH